MLFEEVLKQFCLATDAKNDSIKLVDVAAAAFLQCSGSNVPRQDCVRLSRALTGLTATPALQKEPCHASCWDKTVAGVRHSQHTSHHCVMKKTWLQKHVCIGHAPHCSLASCLKVVFVIETARRAGFAPQFAQEAAQLLAAGPVCATRLLLGLHLPFIPLLHTQKAKLACVRKSPLPQTSPS